MSSKAKCSAAMLLTCSVRPMARRRSRQVVLTTGHPQHAHWRCLVLDDHRLVRQPEDRVKRVAVLAAQLPPRYPHDRPERSRAMSTDNDWWSWIVIGTLFLLTTPAIYVPVGRVLGFF